MVHMSEILEPFIILLSAKKDFKILVYCINVMQDEYKIKLLDLDDITNYRTFKINSCKELLEYILCMTEEKWDWDLNEPLYHIIKGISVVYDTLPEIVEKGGYLLWLEDQVL